MKWQLSDIAFVDIVADETDHPVVTVEIQTPAGKLLVMAELVQSARTLWLKGLHVQSDIGPNVIGVAATRLIADAAMEYMDYDEIIIEGAPRTTGAGPGRRPGKIRFARRPGAAARPSEN